MKEFPRSASGMPLPPGCVSPEPNRQAKPKPQVEVGPEEPIKQINENEVSVILRAHLLPEHQEDPNVLRFISSYVRCRDTAQAAKESGLHYSSGNHLRNCPDVHAAISALTLKSVMKYGFDASEIVERVKEIAGVDPIEIFNADGSCKTNMHDIRPEVRRAIKEFEVKNLYGTDPNGMPCIIGKLVKVKMWDKTRSQEMLGREKDLFTEKKQVSHDVTSNMASILLGAKSRADAHQRALHAGDEPILIEARKVEENGST